MTGSNAQGGGTGRESAPERGERGKTDTIPQFITAKWEEIQNTEWKRDGKSKNLGHVGKRKLGGVRGLTSRLHQKRKNGR